MSKSSHGPQNFPALRAGISPKTEQKARSHTRRKPANLRAGRLTTSAFRTATRPRSAHGRHVTKRFHSHSELRITGTSGLPPFPITPCARLFDTDASAIYHPICPLFITRVYFSCLPPICPLCITPTRVPTVHSPVCHPTEHISNHTQVIGKSFLRAHYKHVWCHRGHYDGHYKAATCNVGLQRHYKLTPVITSHY